jgi:hypothetical protein
MPSPGTSIITRSLRVFTAGALAVGLAACGSSGGSATAAGGASTSSSSSRYQARVKAAECLRAHGVNVPDPSANGGAPGGAPAAGGAPAPGGGGGAGAGAGGGGGGARLRQLLSTSAGQAASKACASEISKAFTFANITPAQRAQFQHAAVKFAQCMRAHNVNIPDPTSNGAGGFGIFRSIPSSERNSPAFKSAFTACSSNLPNRGRFGGGGPGGAGGSVGGPGA